jgi:multidrug efflux pump subunit AcrA (membrane-fusion protein)
MTKRQIIIVAVGLSIIFGSVFLAGFLASLKQNEEKEAPPIPVKAVKTAPVNYKDIQTTISGYGRVVAAEQIELIAEKSGQIKRNGALLKVGRDFNAGQLIFAIDDNEQRLNLLSAKSNFLKDLASVLPDIKIDFVEAYEKWNRYFNSINLDESIPELPKYATEKEKTFLATRNIFSSYYNIKSQETSLAKHRVYAPYKGTITEVYQQEGSVVNPGTRVAKYIRTDKKELRIAVEVENIKWVKKGSAVLITDDSESHRWTGRISRIGEYVNPNTQSLDVFIEITKGSKLLYDGLYLKAVLSGAEIADAAILPREAVFDRNKVYVLEDTVLKVREITVHKTDENTVVYNGLKKGELVVVEPLLNAFNNMPAKNLDMVSEEMADTGSTKVIQTAN